MLHLAGNVEIDFDGSGGLLVADGQQLVLNLDEPAALAGILDLRSLRDGAAGLERAGLTLRVRSRGRLLVLAGHDARAGLLSRVLRLPHVQLDARFALRSVLGRGHREP